MSCARHNGLAGIACWTSDPRAVSPGYYSPPKAVRVVVVLNYYRLKIKITLFRGNNSEQ